MLLDAARLLVFPALMAFAASSDLFTRTISNRVTLALVAGFVALAIMTAMPPSAVLDHAAAGLVVLLIGYVLFVCRQIGGGDAKLAAATALWFGWAHLLEYALYASLVGGVLTLALMLFRRFTLPSRLAAIAWLRRWHRRKSGVPYGIALAAAGLLIYPYTGWMTAGQ